MVGPDYNQQETERNLQIDVAEYQEAKYEQIDLRHWWGVFNDSVLEELISRAEKNNQDLKSALARVKEARALAGVVASELYPVVDANGSVAWSKQSENVNPLDTSEQTLYNLSADTGWEIDLFGRIRRSLEAATAEYQASLEDRRDVLITVRAEVATTYLQCRILQAQLETALKNISSQKSMLELTTTRYKFGLATYLDVAQATRVLANTEADLPDIRAGLAQKKTTLAVLLGEPSSIVQEVLEPTRSIPIPPPEVVVGIPAERIRQRPDIRRAERQLAAQTARIGVATAALYPAFSLTGMLGFSSLGADTLFDAESGVYGLGPSVHWNIFNMGRIRQQIAVEDARTEQALHSYELTLLQAMKEVEDSLKGYHEQRLRLEALEKSVQASMETLDMSTKLYKDGLTGFQDVLDAQRSLFTAESNLDEARGNTGIRLVGVYKALAGGWSTASAPQE